MYCPNCKQEYEGKFCPECGTKLIEKPSGESGVSLNLGDANAISGGLHVSDSHAVHNEDKSVHNITNTTSTVNNITQMSAQKTEIELVQERKVQYLSACKRAYEDNVLEQSEVIELEELRIKIGLDKATAEEILDKVRVMSDRNARKSTLNPMVKTKLKILTENLQKNDVRALMDQIDSLEPLIRKFDHDELSRKYYLVLAALKPEKCIEQKERTKTDTYWESFWSYLAYIKEGRLIDAEETLASLDHFSSYPEDNMTVLAAAGELMMGHADEAKEYLNATTGEYTSALQRFVDSLFLLLAPEMAEEMGADEDACVFYLVNFFGKKDPKAQAEEERLRKEREEAEEERRKAEEAKRKADAERLRKEREEFERKKRAEEERLRKEREEIERRRAEEERRKAEEVKRKADAERLKKEKEEAERKKKAEEERKANVKQQNAEETKSKGEIEFDEDKLLKVYGVIAGLYVLLGAILYHNPGELWYVNIIVGIIFHFGSLGGFTVTALATWGISEGIWGNTKKALLLCLILNLIAIVVSLIFASWLIRIQTNWITYVGVAGIALFVLCAVVYLICMLMIKIIDFIKWIIKWIVD